MHVIGHHRRPVTGLYSFVQQIQFTRSQRSDPIAERVRTRGSRHGVLCCDFAFVADSASAEDGDAVFFGATNGFFTIDNDRFSGFDGYGVAAS